MVRHLVRRLILFVPLLLAIAVLVFLIMQLLPGDPIEMMIGAHGVVLLSPEQIQNLREELGLADPVHVQLIRWVTGAIRGDLGRSLFTLQPVTEMIGGVLPYTLQLVTAAMLFAVAFGVTLGASAALHHNSWIDSLCMLVSTAGISAPDFWLGILLIFVFAVRLHWLPAIGEGDVTHLVLPTIALGTNAMALVSRVTRSSFLEVLREEYVTVAKAKGLRPRTVMFRHVLRNALIPIVTVLSIQVGRLMAGSVVIEMVFARRGVGSLLITAILNKDYLVVQGLILFIAASVLAINLVVDLLYTMIDPRIRYA
jgi:ABC-type dipeptide/oligopeptide/nickel transport system permease component